MNLAPSKTSINKIVTFTTKEISLAELIHSCLAGY